VKLHFRFADRNAEQTVLLLHGFMGHSSDWQVVAAAIENRFNVLSVDLPGHGNSLIGKDETRHGAQTFFDELNRLLERLALVRIHVLGYSMGGRLALQWALAYPNRIEKMVLESVNPGIANIAERELRCQNDLALSRKMESPDFEFKTFLEKWYRQALFADLHRHPHFNHLMKRRLQNNPGHLALALRAFSVGQQGSLWPKLAEMRQPVLLVAGALDQKYVNISAEMQSRNPGFKREVAPGCGHNVHFENDRWFVHRVMAFLT
jgi:2-succinyl-6-hydroxy-2,4-cyclohexadiene-1-carboxylate synthase